MDNQTELLKGIEKRIEANTVAIDVNKKATSELQSTINHQQKGNLRVTGLPEKDDENMRETIIGILTKVIPVSVDRLRETVDTVHRLGQRASAATSNNLPRAVIIQFGMRTVRDEVWKKSKEDFSKEDRLARTKLWPLVQEARSRVKSEVKYLGIIISGNLIRREEVNIKERLVEMKKSLSHWNKTQRFSRLFALQSWLRGWCACNGLGYVDNWSSFWEQPALYRRNGLHPSPLGSVVLSRNIERAIR
ncbi:hypothetical protein SRHO_G00011140 [Serrasalmus rhombeus]